MKLYSAKITHLRTGEIEQFKFDAEDFLDAEYLVMIIYGNREHWKIESITELTLVTNKVVRVDFTVPNLAHELN